MKRKQFLAILMAGALSVGMAPAAAFADETPVSEETAVVEETPAETTQATEETTGTPEEISADFEEEAPAEEETAAPEQADPEQTSPEESAASKETPEIEEDVTPAPAQEGAQIMIGDTVYASLAEAINAARSSDNMKTHEYIKVKGQIDISSTITVPADKYVIIIPVDETGVTFKRAAGFTEDMFSVESGGFLEFSGAGTQLEDESIVKGALTVDGAGDGVTGSVVKVNGSFAMDNASVINNSTTGNGSAINNEKDGKVFLNGAGFSANISSSAEGGGVIYNAEGAELSFLGGGSFFSNNSSTSGGDIYNGGSLSLNAQVGGAEGAAPVNVVLSENGSITAGTGFTDSKLKVQVLNPTSGRIVVSAESADVKMKDVLSQIEYSGDEDFKISDNGSLVSTVEPSVTPTPAEKQVKITGKSIKWTGYDSVQIVFRSNVKGTYYVQWVNKGEQAVIDPTVKGSPVEANKDITVNVTDLPENDADIYVCVVSDRDESNYNSMLFQPISAERPAAPVTETPTPIPHEAKVPAVTESKVQGFENPLTFYPNTFYEFRVVGAGTDNTAPGEGDVRWVPLYWSMSSNPGTNDRHTVWKIGAQSGIYTDVNKTYTMYIFFQKEVYNGSQWQQESGSVASVPYEFIAAPLAKTSLTPSPEEGDGTGTGTDYDDMYITPTVYADGTNAETKSAVSTADESPIGTMMALAAASLLAGGYVLVRRRKKEF